MTDQHGFRLVFLKTRQRRDRIDPGVNTLHSTEGNQRKSVPSVVIRVPFRISRRVTQSEIEFFV
ncbi:MAG: hypothetical protein DWQ34_08555 [Planctomycetota bacterium]|nr:MAG: hypothetical protein DWQ29_24125 [Planctomycetota bacterium]REJ94474.1 MAG: hypothetical protein DWQ34_08555 [Planctomycetota bacterium]REK22583.1 MAG: hypothetical protein DWQ41_19055 [Planctomycetota bacterium]REK35994.1 MAG: hypothetical protein DWQ45_09895 [Planctomycetota bacterium]